jgi:DNA-directed RNA polymerase subunit alpha
MITQSTFIPKSWDRLIRPYKVSFEKMDTTDYLETVVVEPLERGFGMTLGNALRRVLMSSIQGTAVTSVKISGALLEFSSLKGVVEDVTDIVLNLKVLKLRLLGADETRRFTVTAKGPCVVTAGMIQGESVLDVLDENQVICTLAEGGSLDMELCVSRGKGYISVPQTAFINKQIGEIFLDAKFSPIQRVSFEVEDTRVGQSTDYDRLLLTVETNGSLTPRDAISDAAVILHDQLRHFIFSDVQLSHTNTYAVSRESGATNFPSVLFNLVKDLDLPVRCLNCLKSAEIVYVGDLVKKTKEDLLRTPNFGKKSLDDIEALLAVFNLSLGMSFPDWPPQNIENTNEHEGEKL